MPFVIFLFVFIGFLNSSQGETLLKTSKELLRERGTSFFKTLPKRRKFPWARNEKFSHKIFEEEEILVSVKNMDLSHKNKKQLQAYGVGVVKVPLGFCYETLSSYKVFESLPYVKEVKWIKAHNLLYVRASFIKKFSLLLSWEKKSQQMHFRVVSEVFKGLSFILSFKDFKRRNCEISLWGFYEYKKFPLSQKVMTFIFENLIYQMAKNLRGQILKAYYNPSS